MDPSTTSMTTTTSGHCMKRYSEALSAFASGLAQDKKSVQLLSGLVETAMKSPLRASLEPIYRQLQAMNFDKSPFVITSVIGQELLASGHYSAAVVVLESSLKINSCSLKLRGSVFSALSNAYWALNNLDKAITYMQHDLQVSKSLGDTLGECRAHGNLGSAFFAKCNYKEALASHRYQLVLAMKCKHTLQAALALTSLGHVYSAIGDTNSALASHKHCLKIVRQMGDTLAEAREIGNVGTVYLASGDFEKALECHLEYVKLAKLLGNKVEEARAYSNLGSAHHYRRNYEQSIHFHEQVLRISQEIGERIIEAKAYAGLGHAARCMGDLLQAKRWYERQLDIGLVSKDRLVEGHACSNLGIIYQLLGDFDGALKLHWSHLTIAKQLNDSSGISRAYGNIGNAYTGLSQSMGTKSCGTRSRSVSSECRSTHSNDSQRLNGDINVYKPVEPIVNIRPHLPPKPSIRNSTSDDESQTKDVIKLDNMRNSAFSIYKGRGEPDGQQNGHKNSNGSSCNSNHTSSPVIYTKTKSLKMTPISIFNGDIPEPTLRNGIIANGMALKLMPTKKFDTSSSTGGSVLDWDSGQTTVYRRSDYMSRKQLQLSLKNDLMDTSIEMSRLGTAANLQCLDLAPPLSEMLIDDNIDDKSIGRRSFGTRSVSSECRSTHSNDSRRLKGDITGFRAIEPIVKIRPQLPPKPSIRSKRF